MRIIESITIRRATSSDQNAIERLAALDSSVAPQGELLLAEADGVAVAAVELASGVAIADPFEPSADLVDLLRLRAAREGAAYDRKRRFLLRLLPRTA